jgi:hypothetical protein
MRARCPPGIAGSRRGRSAVADEGKHQGGTSLAIFALAQAIVGVLGTVLTALVGARHEVPRIWCEALRSLVANLPTRVQAVDRLRR